MSDVNAETLAKEWLDYDQNPVTRKEVQDLLSHGNVEKLQSCMSPRIAFGTAGLRALVGAGFARMNGLVVLQTSQGLAQYLLDTNADAKQRGVVVGHDARHDSEYFAQLAAAAFLAKGLKVYWLGQVHTPLVPFTVRRQAAVGGVVITASHNPKEDNGYKVYAGNGCQINTPDDELIAKAILKNLRPLSWDLNIKDKVQHVVDDSIRHYNRQIAMQTSFNTDRLPRFVYTPLHGVGFKFMAGAFTEARGTNASRPLMELVSEQTSPDANFSTVKFPNPEEDGALDLAKNAADTLGVDLILANDPDADRFAAAEKVDGTWHQLKGDDIGVLLGHYLYERATAVTKDMTMLTSAVSSQMLGVIGAKEGFTVEETLTGFKWIGNRAREIGSTAIFGYEEALGYMIPNIVFDKDGVATAMLFLEMCSRTGSPYRKLQELYVKYGYFETLNTYWKSPTVDLTAATVKRIQKDPTMVEPLGADSSKTRVRDLMAGTDTGNADGKAAMWSSPSNQMITVWHHGNPVFRDGVRYTIRASGTEPKIKVYIECRSSASAAEARDGAIEVFRAIGKSWFGDPSLKVEDRFDKLLNQDP